MDQAFVENRVKSERGVVIVLFSGYQLNKIDWLRWFVDEDD